MGFHSTLIFYRPRKPPVITGRDLAEFVHRFTALDVSRDRGHSLLKLKSGRLIDADDKPSWWIEPVTSDGVIGKACDVQWDINRDQLSVSELAAILCSTSDPIYRAFVRLGDIPDELRQAIQRVGSAENSEDFVPDEWCMEIGPIFTGLDGEFQVGWIAIGLGGNGYLFPWGLNDAIDRIEQRDELQRVMALCRETWPVNEASVSVETATNRKLMGTYWPHGTHEPWNWYWGVQGLL